ncbi:MAG: hypothetical protein AB1609_17685 [Bacillota bacterium]
MQLLALEVPSQHSLLLPFEFGQLPGKRLQLLFRLLFADAAFAVKVNHPLPLRLVGACGLFDCPKFLLGRLLVGQGLFHLRLHALQHRPGVLDEAHYVLPTSSSSKSTGTAGLA